MGILTFYYLVYIKNLYTLLFLLTLITEAKKIRSKVSLQLRDSKANIAKKTIYSLNNKSLNLQDKLEPSC